MSNHRDSTSAPAVSMPNTVPAAGEAMPKAPDLNDVQADLSRLISLIELADDIVFDFHPGNLDENQRKVFFRGQNLLSVTAEFARGLDKLVDAYSEGLRS